MQYKDQICISCQKTFTKDDDIVVCPECGTPYHRECWKVNKRCINQMLHDAQMGWYETHQPKPEPVQETNVHANAPQGTSIQMGEPIDFCGRKLYPDAPMLGLNPDEEFDGVTMGELCTYIGSNHIYYLPIFLSMKETGRKISFNLIGLLSPTLYFSSRKLWIPAFASLLIKLLLSVPALLLYLSELPQFSYLIGRLNLDSSFFAGLVNMCSIGDIAFSVAVGLFANFIYYHIAKKTIFKVREKHSSATIWERLRILREKGGVSAVGILAVCSVWFVIILGFLTFVMLWF